MPAVRCAVRNRCLVPIGSNLRVPRDQLDRGALKQCGFELCDTLHACAKRRKVMAAETLERMKGETDVRKNADHMAH